MRRFASSQFSWIGATCVALGCCWPLVFVPVAILVYNQEPGRGSFWLLVVGPSIAAGCCALLVYRLSKVLSWDWSFAGAEGTLVSRVVRSLAKPYGIMGALEVSLFLSAFLVFHLDHVRAEHTRAEVTKAVWPMVEALLPNYRSCVAAGRDYAVTNLRISTEEVTAGKKLAPLSAALLRPYVVIYLGGGSARDFGEYQGQVAEGRGVGVIPNYGNDFMHVGEIKSIVLLSGSKIKEGQYYVRAESPDGQWQTEDWPTLVRYRYTLGVFDPKSKSMRACAAIEDPVLESA